MQLGTTQLSPHERNWRKQNNLFLLRVPVSTRWKRRFVEAYIDNSLIYSLDWNTHVKHVCQVWEKLKQYKLYVKAEKCEFHVNRMSFQGYDIGPDGVSMGQCILPVTIKEVHLFLGFASESGVGAVLSQCFRKKAQIISSGIL